MRKQFIILSLMLLSLATCPANADDAIVFADPLVERICINIWDTNQDGVFSVTEAAAVTDLGIAFNSDASNITSFDELKYFTGLQSIPDRAFYRCFKLKSVTIPEGVTNIGTEAFYFSKSLSSLTIPSSVNSIGERAFYYEIDYQDEEWGLVKSRSLSVDISDFTAWCKIDMADNVFTEIDDRYRKSESWKYVGALQGYTLLVNGTNWADLKIPEDITEIKKNAFAYSKPNAVILHDGITSIGDNAFRFSHASFSGGKGIKYIGDNAFEYSGIPSFEFSEGLTYIGSYAFANSLIQSLVLPTSVETIGNYAFDNCSNLSEIYVFNTEPIVLGMPIGRTRAGVASSVFNGVDKAKAILYVPKGCVEKYRAAEGWDEFLNIVEMESSTGISGLIKNRSVFDVYDMSGRKVRNAVKSLDGLQKGIYIVNGRKVMM